MVYKTINEYFNKAIQEYSIVTYPLTGIYDPG
jgi:hypothetical protein